MLVGVTESPAARLAVIALIPTAQKNPASIALESRLREI
jgi:hypothetical protein